MNKKTKTYNKILSSAWLLFLEKGYADTSTREIAKAANVAVGTVFSHFEGKIDLLKAGMYEKIETIISQASLTDHQHEPHLKLSHYALPLFEFYCSNSEFSKILISDIIWQNDFFEQQIGEFKKSLFNDQPEFDDIKAGVMLDCYFMTLIFGLNEQVPKPEKMLHQLTKKISIL